MTVQQHSADPIPRSWGWPVPGGGRAAHVEAGSRFAGTTSQICGLFPFATSSGSDVRGVPIGRHLHTAEPVGLDPAHWLRAGLVSNTGVWVQGQPGIGKSSITKRLLAGLVGFGMRAVVPGDIKGEYTPLVCALDGAVWRLGRGLHSLNPLDAGPLRAALRTAPEADRTRLLETLRARRLSLLDALVTIVRRSEPDVTERRLLGAALDRAVSAAGDREPLIPDVLKVLVAGAPQLMTIAACGDQLDYGRSARSLINALGLLCEGAIRGIFDRPSTARFDHDTPALSLDISALDDDDDDVVAAAMLRLSRPSRPVRSTPRQRSRPTSPEPEPHRVPQPRTARRPGESVERRCERGDDVRIRCRPARRTQSGTGPRRRCHAVVSGAAASRAQPSPARHYDGAAPWNAPVPTNRPPTAAARKHRFRHISLRRQRGR